MTEQENVRNELLLSPSEADSESPTCEEGGGEKGAVASDGTVGASTTSGDAPADFFATVKKSDAADDLEKILASISPAGVIRIGRPPRLTPELKTRACLLLCMGLSRRQAAIWLDIDHATIGHAAERDPDFSRALQRAEEFKKMGPVVALAAAGLKNWRAAAWLLTHQQKQPFTSEQRAENHQSSLEGARRFSELRELDAILDEQRDAAKEQRAKSAKRRTEAEELAERQAEYEAENPQLFRKKKKTAKTAAE